jgi:hypothetical protein
MGPQNALLEVGELNSQTGIPLTTEPSRVFSNPTLSGDRPVNERSLIDKPLIERPQVNERLVEKQNADMLTKSRPISEIAQRAIERPVQNTGEVGRNIAPKASEAAGVVTEVASQITKEVEKPSSVVRQNLEQMSRPSPDAYIAGDRSERATSVYSKPYSGNMGVVNPLAMQPNEASLSSTPVKADFGDIEFSDDLGFRPVQNAGRSVHPVAISPTIPATDQARLIANQLATVVSTHADGRVEVRLNPEELGRVRMILTGSDAAMVVTITAERGEVQELMRRQIDQLAQEFHAMGYENTTFEFGQSDKEPAPDHTDAKPNNTSDDDLTLLDTTPDARATVLDGLDLRL